MRKLTKALAAVLLLAVIVSVMAVLPSFTVSAAGESEEIKTLYDMDSKSSISFSGKMTNAAGEAVPSMTNATVDGQKMWTIDMLNTKTGEALGSNSAYFNVTFSQKVYTQDDSGYASGSHQKRDGGAKNTDYLVVDFDVDTASNILERIYLNMRGYTDGTATTTGSTSGSQYPEFCRAADGSFYVANANESNKCYPTYQPKGDWMNVTLVYDFSSFDASYCYVYFDGVYSGTIRSLGSGTAYIAWFRLTIDHGSAATTDNQQTRIANFTVKGFPANYSGPLAQATAVDGRSAYLGDLADMAYCLEDTPGVDYENDSYSYDGVIASIKRGDAAPIPVKDYYDLSGDLEDGDIVTVYRNIKSPIVIKDGQNITWVDENGTPLSEDAALWDMPTIVKANADSDWIVTNPSTGAIIDQGKASDITASRTDLNGDGAYTTLYKAEDGTYYLSDAVEEVSDGVYQTIEGAISVTKITTETVWNVVDPLYTAATSASAYVCLFGDVTMEGSGEKLRSVRNLVFDLNDNELTLVARTGHIFSYESGALPITRFMNGTLNFAGYKGNLLMGASCSGAQMFFQNLTMDISNSYVFMDIRDGRQVFSNCTITTEQDFLLRSQDKNAAVMEFYNCEITRNVSESEKSEDRQLFIVGNVKTSMGSSKNQLILDGCTVAIKSEKVGATMLKTNPVYCSGTTNTNYAYIRLTNTDVDMSGVGGTSTFISNVPAGTSSTESTSFKTDIVIEGCDFVGDTFYYTSVSNGSSNEYSLVSNVSVSASKIGTSVLTSYNASARYATINLDIADGVMLGTNKLTSSTAYAPVATYDSELSKIVHTSLGAEAACDFIVSSDYRECSYTLGTQEAVPFNWNAQSDEEDAININKVVTLAESEIYKYTWAQDGNAFTAVLDNNFKFKAKSTLILENDLTYNFYVEKTEAFDALLDAGVVVMINGSQLTKESATAVKDGATYYVVRVLDIAPTAAADNAIEFSVSINGAYGEENVEVITGAASVLDYIEGILNKNAASETPNAKSVELMYAILNYITAAHAYEGSTADAKVAELLGDYTAQYAIEGESQYEAIDGVDQISAFYGATVGWGFKGTAGTELTVAYGDETKTVVLPENGIVYVDVPAQYFASGVTVNGKALNLKGYYDELTSDAAKAITEALWNYSYAAAEYAENK